MNGDVVVITGAAGALGSVVARMAAERGARLALIDHGRHGAAPDGAFALGGVDLTDFKQAEEALSSVRDRMGAVHVLLNLAGGFAFEKLEDGDPATWERMFRLNLTTAVNASKAAVPHLVESGAGRIVNVGAASVLKAAAGMGPYAASKSGVLKLTESLAEELKDRNVTVNAVLPSIIDTPQNRAEMGEKNAPKWVRAEDLAAVILFLASREATAVTGALVPVTGRV
ncbi:MAG TPA: SDR family NAD(P)-dependent oxidoreductase [Caulobacteraceae bacterium]|jgi:NAD(P)-dependent dehydrogenase (short-subunit alcohol dehydrogenase family)